MDVLAARNLTTGRFIATRVRVARRRLARAVGLLGQSGLAAGDGLWITPCRGVHTFGMRFAIDLIALDPSGLVVDAVERLKPWRIRLPRPGTAGVLELPAGTLEASGTKVGDRVALESRVVGRRSND